MGNWIWQDMPAPAELSGADLWEILFQQEAIAALLESPISTVHLPNNRFSLACGRPQQQWIPSVGNILSQLRTLEHRYLSFDGPPAAVPHELPFLGGCVGWLGYDLAWELERLPCLRADPLPFPVAYWYEPAEFAILDHQNHHLWLAAGDRQILDQWRSQVRRWRPQPVAPLSRGSTPPRFFPDADGYQQMVRTALHHIRIGDIFQANLSLRYTLTTKQEGWGLYRHLSQINPSPFASYWRTPYGEMISASPERLIQRQGDRLSTRPIAGTRPRGATPLADQNLARELRHHPKEQAEHIMLVDLERNDLGRVSQWGSVHVDELLTIEPYSHVMHLVSNVTGQRLPHVTNADIVRALFPGGTITGCPKVRCMELIETLEPQRRSLFYGSCGYLDCRGNLDLNILIRTLLKQGDRLWGQVGAGIVADSDPATEWEECLHKAAAQLSLLAPLYET